MKNAEKTVKGAIDSIINQDFAHEDMKIIVVDGSSNDKTLDIMINRLSKTDIEAKIFNDEGKGLSTARQIVVDNACGDYIVWVDGDVILPKDFVKRQAEFMEQNLRIGIAGSKIICKEGKLIADLQNLFRCVEPPDAWEGSNICRVKALRQVGGFDRRVIGACEDIDIMARIKAEGWLISINQEVEFYHNCRQTWNSLWNEQKWFGYGMHYINHKYEDLFTIWLAVPPANFIGGLRRASIAYKKTHQKKSFLTPLLLVFQNIAWWLGYIKSHMDNYGHE